MFVASRTIIQQYYTRHKLNLISSGNIYELGSCYWYIYYTSALPIIIITFSRKLPFRGNYAEILEHSFGVETGQKGPAFLCTILYRIEGLSRQHGN